MSARVQAALGPMGLPTVVQSVSARTTAVDQVNRGLELLRKAVSDRDYTLDALQAFMGKDRVYIHKVLQGDKPLSFAFITALPEDVQARFEQLRAESFGLIVVAPVLDGQEAIRQLVGGLMGLLARLA